MSGETPEWHNLARMARNRLDLVDLVGVEELSEQQAFACLSWWASATGGLKFSDAWPGTLGVRAYHWLRARQGAEARGIDGAQRLTDPRAEEIRAGLALHLDWVDTEQHAELQNTWCVFTDRELQLIPLWWNELDVNGQFLSASGGVQLGTGLADYIPKPRTIDGYLKYPGYLRLARTPDGLRECLPYTWRAFARLEVGSVITMNQARFLVKRGVELDASELLFWPRCRQHLAAWAGLWRNARSALAPYARTTYGARIALALVKEVSNTTLGGWLRSADKNHSDLMNKAWADAVVTEGGIRALVSVEFAGVQGSPCVGMRRDAAWFVGSKDFEPVGMEIDKTIDPTGRDGKLGKWKRTRCVPLSRDLVAALGTGSPEMVVRAVVSATKAQALAADPGSGQP